MPRPLTAVERGYIENCISNGTSDPKKISKELQGVGPVTVQGFIDGLKSAKESFTISADEVGEVPAELFEEEIEIEYREKANSDKVIEKKEGETPLEHQARIASSRTRVSKLLARKEGIVVMTEAASEMADARKAFRLNDLTPEQRQRQTERIHKPFDGENQGGAKDTSTRVRG